MNQKIYFITYGSSKEFNISKKHLISLAKYSGIFEKELSFGSNDLDREFVEKYQNILSNKRGGGFWLWKANIINQTLDIMNENDILLYMDAGSSFNFHAKKRFYEYVDILNGNTNVGNFRFECEPHHIEKEWTSKEVFSYFNIKIDSTIGNSTQYEGGHILFQKNNHTRELMKNFIDVVNYDENLITDFYNSKSQIEKFNECRHDQSIFSILSKKMGCEAVKNETDFRSREEKQFDFPILSVRKKGHGLKDRLKHNLFPFYYKKHPSYFKN